MVILVGVMWVLAGLLAAAVAYLWVLAVVALLPRCRSDVPKRPAAGALPSFVVVVPAHNEERQLPQLLRCLQRLDYPSHRYQVWVVADNCTDGTAAVAQAAGVRCLRRDDPARRGKGYALQVAFAEVARMQADAVVVADADSVVSPKLLRALARRLSAGGTALQASNRLRATTAGRSLLLAAENLLEDRLFYGARGRLGLPVLLRGNGVCLATSLLRGAPWTALSSAEDAEYSAMLLAAGERPVYVGDAWVVTDSPDTRAEIATQRSRWGTGHMRVALHHGPRLFLQGLRSGDLKLCDAALALFLTSKTLILGGALGIAVAGYLLRHFVGILPLALAVASLIGLLAYGTLGLILCRPSPKELFTALMAAPGALALRYGVHVASLWRWSSTEWARTPRHGSMAGKPGSPTPPSRTEPSGVRRDAG